MVCSGWMSDLKGSVSVTDNSSTAVENIDRKLTDWIKMHRPISGELKPFDCPQLHRTKLDCVDGAPSWVEIASGGPVIITKASILTSTTGLANANYRAHVYTASPTVPMATTGCSYRRPVATSVAWT
jgi:hypothetical protein